MNSSFRFDGEDISIGSSTAIISYGDRRFALTNLTSEHLAWLDSGRRSGIFCTDTAPPELLDKMVAQGVLVDIEAPLIRRKRTSTMLFAPDKALVIAKGLAPFTKPMWTLFMFLVAVGVLVTLIYNGSPVNAMKSLSWGEFLCAHLIFLLCAIIHEFGHAAACYRLTGLTGSINFKAYRGIPSLSADVSAIAFTSQRGRASVAITGAVLQLFVSSLLALSTRDFVAVGAYFSVAAGAFALVPVPKNDGYWAVCDLLGINLSPSFFRKSGDHTYYNQLYCYFLMTISAGMFFIDSFFIHNFFQNFGDISHDNKWSPSAVMQIYAFIILSVFIFNNIKIIILYSRRQENGIISN